MAISYTRSFLNSKKILKIEITYSIDGQSNENGKSIDRVWNPELGYNINGIEC